MSLPTSHSAEENFRSAFARLKAGAPTRVPPGSAVTQNNVAREAGLDPSALKKSRFPSLVGEIQSYIKQLGVHAGPSERQIRAAERGIKKALSEEIGTLKDQRDMAQSQLLSAQRAVLELLQENSELRARIAELSADVLPFSGSKSK